MNLNMQQKNSFYINELSKHLQKKSHCKILKNQLYYEIIFIINTEGFFEIKFGTNIFLSRPLNAFSSLSQFSTKDLSNEIKGYILRFTNFFNFPDNLLKIDTLSTETHQFNLIENLLHKLLTEYTNHKPLKDIMIDCLLQLLLIHLQRIHLQSMYH